MSLLQFLFKVGDAVAFADKKHKQMIDRIRSLELDTSPRTMISTPGNLC